MREGSSLARLGIPKTTEAEGQFQEYRSPAWAPAVRVVS